MVDIVLKNGDINITGNDVTLFTEDEKDLETAQRLEIKLKSYKRDWFRNKLYGIPWITEVLSKRGSKDTADAYIKSTILSDPEVKSIISYNSRVEESAVLSVTVSIRLKNNNEITIIT